MTIIYRLFLTFNATSLVISIYLIKEELFPKYFYYEYIYSQYLIYALYIGFPLILSYLSVFISKLLPEDEILASTIKIAEPATNSFLPSYLGYFFVALSIPNINSLFFIYLLIFIFTFLSQTHYFNPSFLIFGYNFYYLTTENNVKISLITKEIIMKTDEIYFNKVRIINDHTYID